MIVSTRPLKPSQKSSFAYAEVYDEEFEKVFQNVFDVATLASYRAGVLPD